MDPADRTFYDELFAIEMQALEDAVAAEPEPVRGTFPPSLEERRRMRYRYIKVGRMFRDTKKVERQLRDKLGSTWTLVLEYLGGYLLYSLKDCKPPVASFAPR